jgi:hypothetical protein
MSILKMSVDAHYTATRIIAREWNRIIEYAYVVRNVTSKLLSRKRVVTDKRKNRRARKIISSKWKDKNIRHLRDLDWMKIHLDWNALIIMRLFANPTKRRHTDFAKRAAVSFADSPVAAPTIFGTIFANFSPAPLARIKTSTTDLFFTSARETEVIEAFSSPSLIVVMEAFARDSLLKFECSFEITRVAADSDNVVVVSQVTIKGPNLFRV